MTILPAKNSRVFWDDPLEMLLVTHQFTLFLECIVASIKHGRWALCSPSIPSRSWRSAVYHLQSGLVFFPWHSVTPPERKTCHRRNAYDQNLSCKHCSFHFCLFLIDSINQSIAFLSMCLTSFLSSSGLWWQQEVQTHLVDVKSDCIDQEIENFTFLLVSPQLI